MKPALHCHSCSRAPTAAPLAGCVALPRRPDLADGALAGWVPAGVGARGALAAAPGADARAVSGDVQPGGGPVGASGAQVGMGTAEGSWSR